MKKIVSIGFHPDVVDYSLFPGMTKEKLAMGLKAQEQGLRNMGFDITMCLVDLGETAEKVVRATLLEKTYDAVLIGAGIRTPPGNLPIFEKLINVVHEAAPTAKLCFNSRPEDTGEAFLRWVKPD